MIQSLLIFMIHSLYTSVYVKSLTFYGRSISGDVSIAVIGLKCLPANQSMFIETNQSSDNVPK